MEQPDEELIAQYQSGDERALEVIFQRYKKPVLNYALRILGNRADAEDAAGEVFLVVFSKKYIYNQKAKFSTWLYTVTRNICISRIRKRKMTFSLWGRRDEDGEMKEWDVPDTADLPEAELEKKEAAIQVRKALAKLPSLQKEALVLREYHNLSYEEISKVLDCSLEQVKILIFRGRERLKSELSSFIAEGKNG